MTRYYAVSAGRVLATVEMPGPIQALGHWRAYPPLAGRSGRRLPPGTETVGTLRAGVSVYSATAESRVRERVGTRDSAVANGAGVMADGSIHRAWSDPDLAAAVRAANCGGSILLEVLADLADLADKEGPPAGAGWPYAFAGCLAIEAMRRWDGEGPSPIMPAVSGGQIHLSTGRSSVMASEGGVDVAPGELTWEEWENHPRLVGFLLERREVAS